MAQGTTVRDRLGDADRRHLLVIIERAVETHALPERGDLVIGRASDVELSIDHASISRRHAVLRVERDRIEVEDLGSANGTRVRGRSLRRGQRVVVEPGETIEVGNAVVVVQAGFQRRRTMRVWAHGYFEARFEEECARAEASHGPLALVRISAAPTCPASLVEERVAAVLREGDVLGLYAPAEYEAILCDADPATAERIAQSIRDELDRVQASPSVAVVCHPRDGRAPHVLFGAACAAVRAPMTAVAASEPIIAAPAMRRLYELVARVAVSDMTVLVRGETGVGKELVAEALHRLSAHAAGPLIKVNAGAVPEGLVESELFGHERGAFTGAVKARAGVIESAHGGTLFLDEVAELSPAVQVKLLRVLEDRVVTRLGSTRAREIHVRFVAATHVDLDAAVARGQLRHDLYYRLAGVTLFVPPLRERVDEIAPLARRFAAEAAARARRRAPSIDKDALALLERHTWPGNVRELRNVIERAVLLGGARLEPEHLPLEKLATPTAAVLPPPAAAPPPGDALRRDRSAVERQHVLDALARCGGNQTDAARLLGVSRRTLSTWLDRLEITRPRKR